MVNFLRFYIHLKIKNSTLKKIIELRSKISIVSFFFNGWVESSPSFVKSNLREGCCDFLKAKNFKHINSMAWP